MNDEFGLSAADEVFRAVAADLRRVDPMNDEVARYGGDEFVWLMRRTGIDDAVAERKRCASRSQRGRSPSKGKPSRSPSPRESRKWTKNAGRNRVGR